MNKYQLLISLFIFCGCSKSSEEMLLDYKSEISFSLWETEKTLIESNKNLASTLNSCDSSHTRLQVISDSAVNYLTNLENRLIEYTGGISPEDGRLIGYNDIRRTERFFMEERNADEFIEFVESIDKELTKNKIASINTHWTYNKFWKENISMQEYLFKNESPMEVIEMISRLRLRILTNINNHYVLKIHECNVARA